MSTTFASVFFPPITESDQLADLLRLMCQYRLLTPRKYDECEPIRRKFDPAKIGEISRRLLSSTALYWNGENDIACGSIRLQSGRGKKTGSLTIWTDAEKLDAPKNLVDLIENTAARFESSYGYIHYLAGPDIKKGGIADTVIGDAANPPMMSITRYQLVRCVPDIYWANVFGPEYVELFGRECVLSAPAPVVKELVPNHFYIQLSESILDFASRYDEVDAVRQRVKQHLGIDCFFDYQAQFERTYRVPNLGWEEPARPPLTPEAVMKMLKR